jgi:general secretion pathway protein D
MKVRDARMVRNAHALTVLLLAGSVAWAQEPVPVATTTVNPPAQTTTGQAASGQAVSAAQAAPGSNAAGSAATAGAAPSLKKPARQPTGSERRRAAKLYLDAAKLFDRQQFEEAMKDDQQAAALDPTNPNYALAAEVARGHAVTALMQTAAKNRMAGDNASARAALTHAVELDPNNPDVNQHMSELGYDAAPEPAVVPNGQSDQGLGGLEQLQPAAGVRSFHVRSNQKQLIQQVFKEYGIEATVDDSVRVTPVKFDLDDATFAQAAESVSLVTNSFFVPIDAHRALVARDTRENRQQFTRNGEETVYLRGMTPNEMTDVTNMARNVFELPQASVNQSAGTLTVRAPESKLTAFNSTVESLMDGRSQVLLDVRLIQLAHSNSHNTGVQPPQQVTAFNVYAEEQSILNANQSLVQQIISSGLAAPGDTLTILGILLASGQVTSSLFSNGVALFGGGLTLSGLSPGPATVNLSLNSSDSRELDRYQLRLEDGEEDTLRSGTRYPIETSQFSSLGSSNLNIPGLTSAGNSGNLSSILSSLQGASETIPQVQYQDLGLTLKARPSVMRSGDVAVNIDLKISALAGTSINGVPVLANRAWSGVVTMGRDQAVVVASEMDKQESRAISGFPGLSEIPGLNNITDKDVQKNYSTLLIVITPQVVRGPRVLDHTHMVRIERGQVR